MSEEKTVTFRGVCTIHCESGTEGALWAFQDERFMHIPVNPDAFLVCVKCQRSWNKARGDKEPEGRCPPGTHEWQNDHPDGLSSYNGLHILHCGDVLTIFDKADSKKILWNEAKRKLAVVDHAQWGVRDPGVRLVGSKRKVSIRKWEKWFVYGFPAELTLGLDSLLDWEKHSRIPAEEELKKLGRA